jgi:hypothetical protein
MSTGKFEPYGESLPTPGSNRLGPPKTVSAILDVVGQCAFWLLVVVIVSARIAYFSPAPFATHAVSVLTHSAQR